MGVTRYSTVPGTELLLLVSVWLMVDPLPDEAPVTPVTVPIVQLKVLAAEADKAIFGLVPLQVTAVLLVVTTGVGFTVTVIV